MLCGLPHARGVELNEQSTPSRVTGFPLPYLNSDDGKENKFYVKLKSEPCFPKVRRFA